MPCRFHLAAGGDRRCVFLSAAASAAHPASAGPSRVHKAGDQPPTSKVTQPGEPFVGLLFFVHPGTSKGDRGAGFSSECCVSGVSAGACRVAMVFLTNLACYPSHLPVLPAPPACLSAAVLHRPFTIPFPSHPFACSSLQRAPRGRDPAVQEVDKGQGPAGGQHRRCGQAAGVSEGQGRCAVQAGQFQVCGWVGCGTGVTKGAGDADSACTSRATSGGGGGMQKRGYKRPMLARMRIVCAPAE